MHAPDARQVHEDHVYAFECALNFQLYATGPGSDVTEVGGPGETRSISRRERLADVYARMLLVEVRATSAA
jgi:hypothetical protein